jgi:hypothetical protein
MQSEEVYNDEPYAPRRESVTRPGSIPRGQTSPPKELHAIFAESMDGPCFLKSSFIEEPATPIFILPGDCK